VITAAEQAPLVRPSTCGRQPAFRSCGLNFEGEVGRPRREQAALRAGIEWARQDAGSFSMPTVPSMAEVEHRNNDLNSFGKQIPGRLISCRDRTAAVPVARVRASWPDDVR
jgi:hypothetical protein